ncbi:MAG: nucleotidyl transferase AbiEii/AbiGii toxin family protein, partial [bacterium]|nr:nucleotidyl transferase AbiEii/AbiGii toxin family protein [bacterium]
SQNVYFKGGTCAAMLGKLDRFSVDLDFDLKEKKNKEKLHAKLVHIFTNLGFEMKSKSQNELFYVLKYSGRLKSRSNLKLSIVDSVYKSNIYTISYLSEIDRYVACQSIETMFSHKLVSLTDRYHKHRTIAGRDLYDIHFFFLNGYEYIKEIVEDRMKKSVSDYLKELKNFIQKNITEKIIVQDLNSLLAPEQFQRIKKTLKSETLIFIENEIKHLG